MNRIPLIKPDLPSLDEVAAEFREILSSGRITNFGSYVTAFEQETGKVLGTEVATTSSGTMALIFALQAAGLERGQRVIFPSFTFMATAQAVLYAGGLPLFAEIGDDFTLDPADLEELLRAHSDVGAVVPVHMYGLPARVDRIEEVVRAAEERSGRKIPVLYDAAHAFGSSTNGRSVGGFGTAEVFSLSITKALVSVEGGMVSSRDPELMTRVRRMRNYGIEANYDAWWPGLNGKMSEFHAIVGLHNLRRLDALMSERQSKAKAFIEKIRKATSFQTPPCPAGVRQTFKDFTVLVPEPLAPRRDEIMRLLGESGVETRAYFHPPVHEQRFFRKFRDRPLPRTENLSRRVISLPFYTTIREDDMDAVVAALERAEASVAGAAKE